LTITVEEAAVLLGIGRGLAYEAAARGELPVVRVGRRLLVSRPALERILAEAGKSGSTGASHLDGATVTPRT
jgi:excisionase family DNA binding protein